MNQETAAATPPSRGKGADVDVDVVEIGSEWPQLFLHSGVGPTVPRNHFLPAPTEKPHLTAQWHRSFGQTELPAYAGSCGNLLVVLQSGTLKPADTAKNMRLSASELLSRIQKLRAHHAAETEEIDIRTSVQDGQPAAAH